MGDAMTGLNFVLNAFTTAKGIADEQYDQESRNLEAKQNKALADNAAADAIARGGREAALIRMQGSQLIARQKVAYANAGVDPTVGTPAQVASDTRAFSELDARTAENNAALEAWGYRRFGLKYQQQAALEASRSANRQAATVLGGVGRSLTTFGRAYEQGSSGGGAGGYRQSELDDVWNEG